MDGCRTDGCTLTFVEASPGGLRSEARLAAVGGAVKEPLVCILLDD